MTEGLLPRLGTLTLDCGGSNVLTLTSYQTSITTAECDVCSFCFLFFICFQGFVASQVVSPLTHSLTHQLNVATLRFTAPRYPYQLSTHPSWEPMYFTVNYTSVLKPFPVLPVAIGVPLGTVILILILLTIIILCWKSRERGAAHTHTTRAHTHK